MQYLVDKGYIYIKNENINIGESYILKMCGMKLDSKISMWKGKDDALKRVMLGIPLESPKVNTVEGVTFPPLTDLQREDVKKMVELGSCLNANVMGLGKTLEAIVAINMLGCDKVLIICPKSIKGNWKKELQKWMNVPDHLINIIDGTPKQIEKQLEQLTVPFTIVNYDKLRPTKSANKPETNKVLKALREEHWDAIICDEAHKIKGPKSKQTLGVKSLKSEYRIALTGTPVQNKPDDLWSILHWINPYFSGGSYWRFVEAFCETFDNGWGTQVVGLTKDESRSKALNVLLSHIMIRRENDASLPDVLEIPISITMSDKHKKLYDKIKKEILVELEGMDKTLVINSSLTRMLRLQQCTSNPELLGLKENPKFDFVMDLLDDTDDKIVIFTRFKQVANVLSERLNKAKIKHTLFTGDTKNRQAVIDDFIADDNKRCFIATIGAAGEGIDGLQYVSSTMVYLDKEWSPAKNQQGIGRLVRKGQKEHVKIITPICEGTIDSYVEKVLDRKIGDIIEILKK